MDKNQMDEPKKTTVAGEVDSETISLNYDSELGSLSQDKDLETYKIPDDDKRWELLDPSGGLKKLVLKSGDSEPPKDGEKVSCHYSGFLRTTGEMFDSSRERDELFKFEIGKGAVIKGWDVGIGTMQVGERAILRCMPDFAYGEKGSPPRIPESATLDFVVQLKNIQQYEPLWDTEDAKESISKKTIKEVEGWETAQKLWVVTVTYTGRENDEKGRIWCSGKDEKVKIPFDLEFESKGVIPEYEQPRGFFSCLKNTKEGEVNYFKLKSNDFYTFGSTGSKKFNIAPKTDLFYEMTITAMEKFNTCSWQLEDDEKLPRATELKQIANDYFKRKKLAAAKDIWKDILGITTDMKSDDDKPEQKDKLPQKKLEQIKILSLACHSNTALVEIKLNNFSEAAEHIEKGLAIDSKHEKLRYRRALLHFKRGDWSKADEELSELSKEFPENKGVKALLARNTRAKKAAEKKARKLARKMFGPSAAKKLNEEAAAAKDQAERELKEEEGKAVEADTKKTKTDETPTKDGVEAESNDASTANQS